MIHLIFGAFFCYTHEGFGEDEDNTLLEQIEEKTKSKLSEVFDKQPVIEFEDGMGCPTDDILVGYRGIKYDIDSVKSFVSACIEANRAVHTTMLC